MNNLLYVYDSKSLNSLKNKLSDYSFITLTSIHRSCKKIEDVCNLNIALHAIDLTNFFHDTSINRFFRSFLENYIVELMNEFDDLKFIIKSEKINDFINMYPYLFKENEIFYCSENKVNEQLSIDLNINEIYVYKERSTINYYSDKVNILNFSHLVTDFNGINIKFNYEEINSDDEYYIDITSLIKFLKFRKDQVFMYELIFNELTKVNVRYLINENYIDDVNELFPLLFSAPQELESIINDKSVSLNSPIEKEESSFLHNIDSIIKQLSLKLKGHGEFKKKLKSNLVKFRYLNQLGRRKILSIFICGKSGVGKTEFARLLSQIMYPNEVQIKLNFGNYSTEGVLNSLIGSPLGYVGSEKGGELINKVRESESKVILIDEFEKADGKVFNFFYELLEDGKFTDRAGNEHDLDSYIIIFTSNLNRKSYSKIIPEPLDSRFDMKYFFQPLNSNDKTLFVNTYSNKLIDDIKNNFDIILNRQKIEKEIKTLVENDNLREIKRKIEDIVIKNINLKDEN